MLWRHSLGSIGVAPVGFQVYWWWASFSLMFIGLIQRVGRLQVTRMLIFTGDQGREVIENLYPPIGAPPSLGSTELPQSQCLQTLLHHGHPRVVQAANIPMLVDMASRSRCVIELIVTVGDTVLDSVPILHVYGAASPLLEETLRPTIELGRERTFEQDPKYAIRLLVDIANQGFVPRSE